MEWLQTGTVYLILLWLARLFLSAALSYAAYEGFSLVSIMRREISKKSAIISIFPDNGGRKTKIR